MVIILVEVIAQIVDRCQIDIFHSLKHDSIQFGLNIGIFYVDGVFGGIMANLDATSQDWMV